MIYVTGDTHGDLSRLSEEKLKFMRSGDTLIICGDFGFIWENTRAEEKTLRSLGKRKYNICFIDGTHDNHALLSNYPVVSWNGGKARHISGNLYNLMRGEVYTLDRSKVFTMGGGQRRDTELELLGEDETALMSPSKEDMLRAVKNLEENEYNVDYIVTHEPPSKTRDFLLMRGESAMSVGALDAYLDELAVQCKYSRWFFGSMHEDKFISNSQIAVYRKIINAATGIQARTR